jgi:glycerol kinase
MSAASSADFSRLRVDGGASANDWMMQFQADILGVPVERPDCVDTTALGAAGLAGIASGVWASGDDFVGRRNFTIFEPRMSRQVATELLHGWHRAVDTAIDWASRG